MRDDYWFVCKDCGFREKIPRYYDTDMDIQEHLDKVLSIGTGVHLPCGTMTWGIRDKNNFPVV